MRDLIALMRDTNQQSPINSLEEFLKFLNLSIHNNIVTLKFSLESDNIFIENQTIDSDLSNNPDLLRKSYTHPYFAEPKSIQKVEAIKELPLFDEDDNIAVFSPHQDDEILGASILLANAFHNKNKLHVVYLTSGKGGGDPKIRQTEAISSIKIIGGTEDNLCFENLPYYDKPNREVSEEDYEYTYHLLQKLKPNKIFICADVFDPSKSHRKCYDVLMKVLFNYSKLDFEFEAYFYYSSWYWPKLNEFTHVIKYENNHFIKKVSAMLEHKSQLNNGFMGQDDRPFYERATARDREFGKLFDSSFVEVYYKIENLK